MSIEEMAEIPKDVASAQGKRGCSKGVNLFLARQKLIADMMEEEETDSSVSGSAVRINEGTEGWHGLTTQPNITYSNSIHPVFECLLLDNVMHGVFFFAEASLLIWTPLPKYSDGSLRMIR